jgi:hypothetical protein
MHYSQDERKDARNCDVFDYFVQVRHALSRLPVFRSRYTQPFDRRIRSIRATLLGRQPTRQISYGFILYDHFERFTLTEELVANQTPRTIKLFVSEC